MCFESSQVSTLLDRMGDLVRGPGEWTAKTPGLVEWELNSSCVSG
jgi:hypothetical protein